MYVDDILICSNDDLRTEQIKQKLADKFEIKDLGPVNYCLGIDIRQTEGKITLSQENFIREVLSRFEMTECKAVRSPVVLGVKLELNSSEKKEEVYPYRELIGSLMYIAVATRPDIAHAVNMLSQFNHSYDDSHWQAAKRILRYLQGT